MKKWLLCNVMLLMGAPSALGADLYYEPPPPPPEFGGWYLRGHFGMSNQRVGEIHHPGFDAVAVHEFVDEPSFDSGLIGSLGIGYQFTERFRADAFVEYRGRTDFSALDRYQIAGPDWDGTNDYDGGKSEWLVMANAYVDLGNYSGFVPYVGAGIGASRNTISRFRDINVPNQGVAYADEDPTWNFAWALHAGLGYQATERMTVEFGYSYVNLGDAQTGTLTTYDGTPGGVQGKMKFKDITSHDFKLGLRYSLQ